MPGDAVPALHPTPSWWLEHMPSRAPNTAVPPHAEVLVIGAGLTGCSVAWWLSRAGRRCTLLDARGVAGGATGRNGGHLRPDPARSFEVETTRELLDFICRERVDCDLRVGGAIAVPGPGAAPAAPTGTAVACTPHEVAKMLGSEAGAQGPGVFSPDDVQFFPAKVVALPLPLRVSARPLLEVAAALLDHSPHARLFSPVTVQGISAVPDAGTHRYVVATDAGPIKAAAVVVATNAWTPALLPELHAFMYPTRNHVLMTHPMPGPGLRVGGFVLGRGADELYAIARPDGRICCGGLRGTERDAAVGNADDSTVDARVSAALQRALSELWPGRPVAVERVWTGALGFTTDGRPLIGPVPGRPHVYVAAAFCGHGMPVCYGAGKAVAQMITGAAKGDVHPFVAECDPARFTVLPATGMSHLSKEEDVAATATGVTYVQGCSHDRTKDHGIRLL